MTIFLGCSITPVILNLHHFKRDSYIVEWMPGLRLQWKAVSSIAVTHLALLGVKIQETAFWGITGKR